MSSSVDQLLSIRILEEINRGLREEAAHLAVARNPRTRPLWYRAGVATISLIAAIFLGVQL